MAIRDPFNGPEDIGIGSDQLAFIVLKARAYDVEVEGPEDSPGDGEQASNLADDRAVEAIEADPDNTNARQLQGAIRALDIDAQIALVALAWLGRGDFEASDWAEAEAAARERHNQGSTVHYLLGMPLLGDFIEDGAAKLGMSLTEDEQIGMHNPITEEPSEDDRS
jgi:hypothetical protein